MVIFWVVSDSFIDVYFVIQTFAFQLNTSWNRGKWKNKNKNPLKKWSHLFTQPAEFNWRQRCSFTMHESPRKHRLQVTGPSSCPSPWHFLDIWWHLWTHVNCRIWQSIQNGRRIVMVKCQQAPAICCCGCSTEVKCAVGQCRGGHFCCVMAHSQGALGLPIYGFLDTNWTSVWWLVVKAPENSFQSLYVSVF